MADLNRRGLVQPTLIPAAPWARAADSDSNGALSSLGSSAAMRTLRY